MDDWSWDPPNRRLSPSALRGKRLRMARKAAQKEAQWQRQLAAAEAAKPSRSSIRIDRIRRAHLFASPSYPYHVALAREINPPWFDPKDQDPDLPWWEQSPAWGWGAEAELSSTHTGVGWGTGGWTDGEASMSTGWTNGDASMGTGSWGDEIDDESGVVDSTAGSSAAVSPGSPSSSV